MLKAFLRLLPDHVRAYFDVTAKPDDRATGSANSRTGITSGVVPHFLPPYVPCLSAGVRLCMSQEVNPLGKSAAWGRSPCLS